MNDSPLSVLMYSHDGFGLGHLRRNFNIAKRIVQEFPGSQVLLIMGHSSVPFQPIPKGIDFIKLPSIVKVSDEQWQPRGLKMSPEEFKKMRAALIKNVAQHFQPDLFLVDYVPKGVWGELIPTLELLKQKKIKILLGIRDIIDEPQRTRERWRHGNTYDVIRDYYDKIFIYGSKEVFDTAYHYLLVGELAKKTVYCGYLCSEEECRNPAQIRRELGLQEEKLIVITAGGGADAYSMMKLSLEALEKLHRKIPFSALVIAGPLMEIEKKQALEKQAESLPVRVLGGAEGLLNIMNAADLLITMGSYNTLMESLRLNRPTIVIPRDGPSAEQKIRAQIFSDLGFVWAVNPPDQVSASTLSTTIEQALKGRPFPKIKLNMGGLSNVIKLIKECLEEKAEWREDEKSIVIA